MGSTPAQRLVCPKQQHPRRQGGKGYGGQGQGQGHGVLGLQ